MSTVLDSAYAKHAVGLASLISLMKKAHGEVAEACRFEGDAFLDGFRNWFGFYMQLHGLAGSLKMFCAALHESEADAGITRLYEGLYEIAEEAIKVGGDGLVKILQKEPEQRPADDQHE